MEWTNLFPFPQPHGGRTQLVLKVPGCLKALITAELLQRKWHVWVGVITADKPVGRGNGGHICAS